MQQAIFTSADATHASGYRLVARSPAIDDSVARELTHWSPSHDSLVDASVNAKSINYCVLSTGQHCVSRSITAGREASQRGGYRIHTHWLLLDADDFARFANNPFQVLRAAIAAGTFAIGDDLPRDLPPVVLTGHAPAVDYAALRTAERVLTRAKLLELAQRVLDEPHCLLRVPDHAAALVAGILSVMPVERRREITFTTGLRVSSQRPFRLATLPATAVVAARVASVAATIVDVDFSRQTVA